MRASQFIFESKVNIKNQIIADVNKNGGDLKDYFVRFTDIDKLGYSAKQAFGKTLDVDDNDFSVDSIGQKNGRPVLWFYPLQYYLKQNELFATTNPYAWLVKLKPTAWLQTVKRGDTKVEQPPHGKERAGILRMSDPPAALFFKPLFDVIGKYYDYGGQHTRHGNVKGPTPREKLSWFQRIRGD
jgi:hypothetical protein